MRINSKIFRSYKSILILSFISYVIAYFGRLNIGPSISAMQESLSITNMQIGIITSSFFWVYALGQLLNGYLGDKLPANLMIGIGLIGSAVCNYIFQLSSSYIFMAIIWGLNGLFQSMLWGPIIKSLVNWSEPRMLPKAAFIMSLSCVTGNAIANGSSSFMATHFSWQICYIIPSIIALLFGIFILIAYKGKPGQDDFVHDSTSVPNTKLPSKTEKSCLTFMKFVVLVNLPSLLLIAVMQGLISNGFNVWFPKILQETGLISINSMWMLLLLIPIINFSAISLTNTIKVKFNLECYKILLYQFAFAFILALILTMLHTNGIVFIIILILFSVIIASANPLLTSYIPFTFSKYKWVSFVAGIIDFAIYLGSALSGIVIGIISDTSESKWNGVMIFWAIAALIATVCTFLLIYTSSKSKGKENQTV